MVAGSGKVWPENCTGRASKFFVSDEKLGRFLKHSAEDEAWHFHVMDSAAEYLKNGGKAPGVSVDRETRDRINRPFNESLSRLADGSLTVDSLLDCIVKTEFSEWNDIFVYVVNRLKADRPEFASAAAKMQHHLRHIEHFLSERDQTPRFRQIPSENTAGVAGKNPGGRRRSGHRRIA